jgi:putative transposase
MARLARYFLEGHAQHIIQRGNNRELIFADTLDYHFYLECLLEAADVYGIDIHAYVLMTNHVHILCTPQAKNSIGKTLQSIGRRYVGYFNYTYKRTGTLWEGRYKATLIDSEQYLLTCMRYIELNPVRAKMVSHPVDYPWSSYSANADGKENPLVKSHDLYCQLGRSTLERRTAYRQLFRSAVCDADLEAIRKNTNKAWVLGNDRFREKVEQLTGRRTIPKPKGRPRKVSIEK